MKQEFRNVKSSLIERYINLETWHRERTNDNETEADDDVKAIKDVLLSSNFVDFCRGYMCMFYLYACSIKYVTLNSTVVSMLH